MAGRTCWWGQGPRDGGLLEGSGLTAVGYFYPPSFSIAFRGNVDADRTLYLKLERPTMALRYGEQALVIDQKNTKALFRCGQVSWRAGTWE